MGGNKGRDVIRDTESRYYIATVLASSNRGKGIVDCYPGQIETKAMLTAWTDVCYFTDSLQLHLSTEWGLFFYQFLADRKLNSPNF